MEKLNIFLLNKRVGKLWLNDRQDFVFRYDADYLKSENPVPVSFSLPLSNELYEKGRVRSFFSNLLPEGELRSKIAREKKISVDNDFLLLKEIGGECAGAISLLEDETPPGIENEYELIADDELHRMIDASSIKPILINHDELRLSLAGAQNKIPLYYNGGRFYLPKGNSPSSHILKLATAGFQDLVENELFCMRLANHIGFPVPGVFLWANGEQRAFIIERYDRSFDENGNICRLHQEDFCQITGTMPDRKYENEGGPGIAMCVDIINRYCSVPVLERKKMVDWVIFNFLIGNCDAHAKNISLLYSDQRVTLAPFYDLVSTLIYPELSKKMAMHIGGKKQMNYLFKKHWERLSGDLDIKYSALASMFADMAEKLQVASKELAEEFRHNSEAFEVSQKICMVIQAQAKGFV